ncbi:HNH endonuclease [Arthrobacter gengyunqii]|uniref:HNH endonuclease n=1 Tax=Arthrobacter gengyunqii TaxID=2886940 RepID=A0ABS8GKP2_9MICC|nr:DUF222 domain-containing protein [Arthrobacter gengyunqii]MCC3266723.1 HNH endonuclease [Arthrobacter gengyunqii]
MYYSSAPDRGSTSPGMASVAVGKRCGRSDPAPDLEPAAAEVDAAGLDPAEVDAVESAVRVQLIDHIRALEELKGSICAAQARAAAVFDESSRRSQARAGVKADQLGRGIAAQIALARRESPNKGARLLGLARILSTEMPHTLRALSRGIISEWRATILVRETACLTLADRQKVDELIAGDQERLAQLGDRKLIAAIRTVSYGLDPLSVVNRAAKAASERFVSCRPAPDTMAYVTALLPVAQGVGVMAALMRTADRTRAAGDPRSKGQVMADTFVELLTGQARAEDLRVEVQLIMTDRTLLHGVLPPVVSGDSDTGGGDTGNPDNSPRTACGGAAGSSESFVPDGAEPAVLAGYGIVPAQWARDLIRRDGSSAAPQQLRPHRRQPRTEVWLRRLYTAPDTGRLTAMDSRARMVPDGLARLIAARDQVCRTPWCGAPLRHYDHIKPFREGGPTSADNIQGLCEACNQAKEAPGWTTRCEGVPAALADNDGTGRHSVTITTPTGHIYRSTAPLLPGSR